MQQIPQISITTASPWDAVYSHYLVALFEGVQLLCTGWSYHILRSHKLNGSSWEGRLTNSSKSSLVCWGCRIHQHRLCRGVRPHPTSVFDITLNNLMAIWAMWCTLSLLWFSGSLWPRVIAPDRIITIDQIERTLCKQMTDVKFWRLYRNTWKHLTVC